MTIKKRSLTDNITCHTHGYQLSYIGHLPSGLHTYLNPHPPPHPLRSGQICATDNYIDILQLYCEGYILPLPHPPGCTPRHYIRGRGRGLT